MRATRNRTAKYVQIRNEIRDKIANGLYPPGTRIPTDAELSSHYQVNRITVLRALEGLIQEEMIFRQQGSGTYVSDRSKRVFIPARSCKLGLLWSAAFTRESFELGFHAQITRGILRGWGLEKEGPTFSTRSSNGVSGCAVFDQPQRKLKVVCLGAAGTGMPMRPSLKAVEKERFDGIITVSISDETWLEQLWNLDLPLAVIDHPSKQFAGRADRVYIDPQNGYGKAVEHAVRNGVRRVCFVGQLTRQMGPGRPRVGGPGVAFRNRKGAINIYSFMRMSAVRQALLEMGSDLPEEHVHYVFNRPSELRALSQRLLTLPAKKRPEAVFCHDAGMAERIVEHFEEKGAPLMGVGETSYDGRFSEGVLPIRVKHEELGVVAAELLHARLRQPNRHFLNVGIDTRFSI